MSTTESLGIFKFHGVSLTSMAPSKGQAKGTCPFCEHSANKFYANVKTGLWDCKNCGESGNPQQFLSTLHAHYLKQTTPEHYKALAKKRPPLTAGTLKRHKLAYDGVDRWIIPVYNLRGKLINLRVYTRTGRVMGTTGLPNSIWLLDRISDGTTILITEGEWDAMALSQVIRSAKLQDKYDVLSVPGASSFPSDWLDILGNRDVILLYDNDNAGEDGMRKTGFKLQGRTSSIETIKWPSSLQDGFDVRDYIQASKAESNGEADAEAMAMSTFTGLMHSCHPVEGIIPGQLTEVEIEEKITKNLPKKKPTFKTLVKEFSSRYYFTQETEDALAVVLAVTTSIRIRRGDPIWMFLVGPPGCGKTLLLKTVSHSSLTVYESAITPSALVSGWMGKDGEVAKDVSLIPQLRGKCLVLKDYTEILSMNMGAQEEIYGILRGAFDGDVNKIFGNGLRRRYQSCFFSIIAGVTDVIHGNDRASLGERFLKYQMQSSSTTDGSLAFTAQHIAEAINSMWKQAEHEDYLKKLVDMFLTDYIAEDNIPTVPQWYIDRVIPLASLIAFLRASGNYSLGELTYRPVPEVASRLAKQLIQFSQALALVYGKHTVDKACYRIVKKMAFDTAIGWSADIVRVLIEAKRPLTTPDLENRAKIPSTTLERKLRELSMMELVTRTRLTPEEYQRRLANAPTNHTGRGPTPYEYTPHPTLVQMWKDTK